MEKAVEPIGFFYSDRTRPYDLPRQPDGDEHEGVIELLPQKNFEQALDGLEGFERIWIFFQFHHNQNWKPKILPPRGRTEKIGVFATRSPYRPNPLGLSCVQLLKIEGRKLWVKGSDLMNETPIYDIKPYVSFYDSFPNSKSGWLQDIEKQQWQVEFSPLATEHILWLQQKAQLPVKNFIQRQLEFDPLNSEKKRVRELKENEFVLAYRTWRIYFSLGAEVQSLKVICIGSGYSSAELESHEDPYKDKKVHHEFLNLFG